MKYIFRLLFILLISKSAMAQTPLYQKILTMVDSVSTPNIVEHIKKLEWAGGHRSRVNFTPGNDSAKKYIYNYLSSLPGAIVKVDTFFITSAQAPYNNQPQFNVEINFPGIVNDYYVIGAHYDASASRMGTAVWNSQWKTIAAPGADDNATGVASLLEMARIYSDTSFSFTPYYGLKLVLFGAEETGPAYSSNHHGSKFYAKQARLRNDNILGMISLDMIGYNLDNLYQAIVSNLASVTLGQQVLLANDLFSIGLAMNAPPFVEATYSDHQSFWDEGYKAILIIENAPPWNNSPLYQANPYYHTSYDTLGTLNIQLVSKVAKLNLALLAALSARLSSVPVELTAFNAHVDNGIVHISWATASEINNYGFEIQRGINNEEFYTVAFVKGNGTSTETHDYKYYDDLGSVQGTVKYRLKQLDYDGKFEYSDIVELSSFTKDFVLLQNYPNPFNPETKIKYHIPAASEVQLKVYDLLGKEVALLVNSFQPVGVYEVNFNAYDLSSGIYLYELKAGSQILRQKMLLLK
jgi:hypothetical protein